MRAFLFVLVALLVACSGPVKRPDGGVGLLSVGSRAPEVEGRDAGAHDVKLSELRGKVAVVYFYPADGTPGCTAEACAFRDAWKKYEEANVAIFGVSSDTPEMHRKFEHDNKIPFPLASDPKGEIAKSYGVRTTPFGYERVSFLVDRDGRIARVWSEVDPGVHAEEVLREAKTLH